MRATPGDLRGTAAAGALLLLAACGMAASDPAPMPPAQGIRGPLGVSSANPRYFADSSGRVVFLAGSHTWNDLQDGGLTDPPPAFDYDAFLDSLGAHGQNFFRLWRWEQAWGNAGTAGPYRVWPDAYQRTGPGLALDGKPRFDLTRFDPAYFGRLRSRVAKAQARGIYVAVMLFDGWSVERKRRGMTNPWEGHPFNRRNNVNGVDGDPDGRGDGSATHTLRDPVVTRLQEAYVRRVVDAVGDLDNVLYEVSNESPPASTAWQYHMIRFVRALEGTRARRHPVGMTAQFPGGHGATLLAGPADWISMGGRDVRMDAPRPADGRKVLVDDTDHLCGICGSAEWAWESFLRGRNLLMMDPALADYGTTEPVDPREPGLSSLRHNLGYIRGYALRADLARMTPRPELASTGFCLAKPTASGGEYLAYVPGGLRPLLGGRHLTVDLRATRGRLAVEWFSPRFERVVAGPEVTGGAIRELRAPFPVGDAVVYLHQ